MGNKDPKQSIENRCANLSDLSKSSDKGSNQEIFVKDNNLDTINDLKKEVNLPIENELIESSEFLLEGKEESKIKSFLENNDNFLDESLYNKKRSKTYAQKLTINKTPRPRPKESFDNISPLKLSIKSYGNVLKFDKKPNAILYDFQKNIIDCKSCNDEVNLDEFFLFKSETERTTPSVEDLHDLLNCRKKMTMFKNCINDRNIKEYENILSSDYIFDENKDELNINNFQQKKNNFWCKHIKQQQLKDKNKAVFHTKRIISEPLVNLYDYTSNEEEDKKDHGLFILGVLESAANERKRRNNTVVFKYDYNKFVKA